MKQRKKTLYLVWLLMSPLWLSMNLYLQR